MKPFIQQPILRSVLAISCLLTTSCRHYHGIHDTNRILFSANGITRRGELNKTTLDHNLIIATADHFKNGNVFVGFHLKSRPDTLWLLASNLKWSAYDGGNPIDFGPYGITTTEPLRPVMPVMPVPIIPLPLDLTAFSGDGEIWVGYGLRNSAEVKDAYQDMINNQRYARIWSIGGTPYSKLICLTATQMRVDDQISSPSSQ